MCSCTWPQTGLLPCHRDGPFATPLRAVVTQMPATLPREPVEVGQSWVRTMEIPLVAPGDGGGSAALSGTFRLDSVSRGGDIAYVSLTGRLARSTNVPYGARGKESNSRRAAVVSTSGSITGSMVIDRARGWITDVGPAWFPGHEQEAARPRRQPGCDEDSQWVRCLTLNRWRRGLLTPAARNFAQEPRF